MAVVEIEIPDFILQQHPDIEAIKRTILENLVVEEYRLGNLTIREAAALLGLTYIEFMQLLGKKRVSVINLSREELEEDRKTLERLKAKMK